MAGLAQTAINRGSLKAIFDMEGGVPVAEPVLQCVQIKSMAAKTGDTVSERFRVIFSDTENFIQSMLATQSNYLVTDGTLKKGSLVRLKQYQPNLVKEKKIIIVLDLEVLAEYGEHEKIGEPTALAEGPVAKQESPAAVSANGFYGSRPPVKQEQTTQRALPTRSTNTDSSHGNLYPIEALSPYAHKWTIKARVTQKGDIKSWHNNNGEGRLFSVNLLDESGEIRATVFASVGDHFDTLYEQFQEGGVYYISAPCQVKMAKKQFSTLNNDYELAFERDTKVETAQDQADVPQVRYSFTNIGELQNVEKDTTIDTIGVLKEVGELNQIVSKSTQKPYDKRELTLVDNTLHQVRLTIWGKAATSFEAPVESVIAFKGVKVSDFGGRSLSLLASGTMSVDPDIPEAHRLKGWYDAQGRQDNFASHSSLMTTGSSGSGDVTKTIAQTKEENLGMNEEKPDYFNVKGTVVYIRQENIYYPACASEDCNKKVVEVDPGSWRCEKCDRSFPKPQYRYVLSFNVADHTGSFWLSCFDEQARSMLGKTADEMNELKEADETKTIEHIFQEANCKSYIFKVKAKMDTFRDEQKVRMSAMSVTPLNFKSECAKLTQMIKQYSIADDSLFVP
ncbi:hypothetical protein FKW77_007381 [Venturia effusa]|uniref:Replication protein A subunit n=1 Tax=Venturia effusa TaxID=50376 RepID=A0A517L7P2_9PEZI|nr:hypothetical protein FKW77_007381 [Venturia effusa]